MPGINLLIYKDPPVIETVSPDSNIIYQCDLFSVAQNLPYPSYPVNYWETTEFVFITEGYFFEWEDWKEKITSFAHYFFNTGREDSKIASLVNDLDAEFIIIIYCKQQKSLVVFNDVLGRFPFYISETNRYHLLSRNPGFIHRSINLTPNSQAFFETMALGYSLGAKTLYKEINRIPAGTAIEVSDGLFKMKRYHQFNYESIINNDFNRSEHLPVIQSLFVKAIRKRCNIGDMNIVALSGGLDSRAVACAFKAGNIPHKLISYLDLDGDAQKDIKYAKLIANALHEQLEVVKLPYPRKEDIELYFAMKYGLNALDMTYLLNFYRYLLNLSDRPVLFTGDGGDKVFPDLTPPRYVKSPKAIVNYAISANSKMQAATAAHMLGKKKSVLFEEILQIMSNYPEKDWSMKYVHFIMDNRVANWLTEGEDRNRCFLQSFTPFYSLKLYNVLMSVPLREKRNFKLYNMFLKTLSSEVARIPNANWGFGVDEKQKLGWLYFKQGLKYTEAGQGLGRLLKKNNALNADNLLHIVTLLKVLNVSNSPL